MGMSSQPSFYTLSCPIEVWTPSSPLSCNFANFCDDFDDDGRLIGPSARSNPTARRRQNHLESCITKVTRVSTLSMGHSSLNRQNVDLYVTPIEVVLMDYVETGNYSVPYGLLSARQE